MIAILSLFVGHWVVSVFFQTFFLHRYASHRMFTMSPRWEKFFHFLTFLTQGPSYLVPRGYAILHREHHAFSDTERDPHSPHTSKGFFDMMWKTALRYGRLVRGQITPEDRFAGGYPEWPTLERFGDSLYVRIGFGALFALYYMAFAPHWAFYVLLPVHWLMGPVHGAIVNWGGHTLGYRNFATPDKSKNTLVFDFLTMGELFQNNHHRYGMSPNFAARWFEIDPSWQVIRLFVAFGIIRLNKPQQIRYPEEHPASALPARALPIPELPFPEAREPELAALAAPSPADAE